VSKREIGELFEVFSDPRPSGAKAMRGRSDLGAGFRKFLEDRGEYPFKDDEGGGGMRFGKIFRIRTETVLVLALAFLIANIASFSIGVWNGKKGAASAGEPSVDAREPGARALEDVAPSPTVTFDPVPRTPVHRTPARTPVASPAPGAATVSAAGGKYTIRVVSLGLSQAKIAREIEKFFASRGYAPTKLRTAGKNLVIEVGSFASTKEPKAVRALKDVQRAKYKFTKFKDAYFVRRN